MKRGHEFTGSRPGDNDSLRPEWSGEIDHRVDDPPARKFAERRGGGLADAQHFWTLLLLVHAASAGLGWPAKRSLCVGRCRRSGAMAAEVELENSCHHDHGLRPVAVLEHGEFERFGSIDEKTAAQPLLVLDNPMALAIPAHTEHGRPRDGRERGRFTVVHGTSPCM
jgi:hypothetical protein